MLDKITLWYLTLCRSRSKGDYIAPSYHDYVGKSIDMEPSHYDYVGKMQCYETLESDPLIGNNLRVNVAASSPCIGLYKLTCLQFQFSLPLTCGLWALHCRTLVVLAGWFLFCGSLVCSPSSWCSCVGCVELLLRGMRCIAPLWLYCISPSWLRCIAPLWAVLHCSFMAVLCSSFVGCVDSLQAVLYRYFVGSVEGCSILPVRKGFQHPRSSLLTAWPFAGKRLRNTMCILF